MPVGDASKRKAEESDRAFFKMLREGKTPDEARQVLGFGPSWVKKRREKGVAWRRLMDNAIAAYDTIIADGFPDFLSFREEHFAYMSLRQKNKHTGLKQINRASNSWFQIDASKKLREQNRSIIVIPPGHIKTTFFAIEMTVYEIMKDRNFRGLVVQKNQGEASKVVAAVQDRLQCDYYHHFAEMLVEQQEDPITCPVCKYGGKEGFKPQGRDTGDKWGAMGFKVSGTTSGEKDLTFQALGFGSQIQGIRADRIVIDDLQDPMIAKQSETDSLTKLEWFRDVILGRVTDTQQVVVLANFFAPNDFAHKLIDEYPFYPQTNYPAVLDDDKGTILCPEFWTKPALDAKRKEVGEMTWHFTWMQSEGGYDEQVFNRDALERARDEDYILGTVHPNITHMYVGVDPAITNYCSIIAWGLDARTGQRFLVEDFNKKGMRAYIPYISDAILDICAKYPLVHHCVIESVSQQKSLHNNPDFQKAMRNLGVRILPYATATATGARSEAESFDISSVGGLFDAGLVTLPYGGSIQDRKAVDEYITEMVNWRPGVKTIRKDRVMATLFAESEAFIQAQRGARLREPPKSRNLPNWVEGKDGRFAFSRSLERV